jgi:Flp pilus assembly pilin Flp
VARGELAECQLPNGRRNVTFLRSLPIRSYLAVIRFREREEGQALVEYALILFLVSIVSFSVLTALGGNVSKMYSKIAVDF